ncbi:hypothetical protein EHQ81_03975 [Leptospira selangorensis]|uniref:Uncharacterized protein n=1 Tax=Leptospira selangorensis TaxID=2484982 RepID=A0A5F2C0A4_9LEPT|nr:hypothetical protein [Leptospira selangorensis]TGM15561.1 hypothetical protein EHQ81_03975 [Leptospira selangorensis]TGM18489.1 hypothetical protein EHQ82_15730 [Leptospira selangorensis]
MKRCLSILFLGALFVLNCSLLKAPRFSKEKLDSYISTFRELKESNSSFGELISKPSPALIFGPPSEIDPVQAETIAKKNGFNSYREFALLHFQIKEFYDLYNSEKLIGDMKEAQDQYTESFQIFLNDPNMPDSAKDQIRESIRKAKELQEENLSRSKNQFETLRSSQDPAYTFVKEKNKELKELYTIPTPEEKKGNDKISIK